MVNSLDSKKDYKGLNHCQTWKWYSFINVDGMKFLSHKVNFKIQSQLLDWWLKIKEIKHGPNFMVGKPYRYHLMTKDLKWLKPFLFIYRMLNTKICAMSYKIGNARILKVNKELLNNLLQMRNYSNQVQNTNIFHIIWKVIL